MPLPKLCRGDFRHFPVLVSLFIFQFSVHADSYANITPIQRYTEKEYSIQYDRLLIAHGNGKELPPGYELQTLIALSHYPELKDTRIRFMVKNVSIPLSSRPHWASMFRSAANRRYQVIIDTEREGSASVLLLKNQPFNAQIGIIGHELSHTVYYLHRSFFGIVADAFCQLGDCRIGFERSTDRRLIEYGLGWQRLDHARFVRGNIARSPQQALDMESAKGAYMSPAEISAILENHPLYQ